MRAMERNLVLEELRTMKTRMDELYAASFAEKVVEKPGPPEEDPSWNPAVDIWESEREWIIVADLPGAEHENVQVEVIGNQLVIAGTRKDAPARPELVKSMGERPTGAFHRSFILPVVARPADITAEFRKGVLTVTVPKDCISTQRIEVRADPE